MEKLLTQENIITILNKARDPIYKMVGLVSVGSNGNPLTIASITPNGLIFIHGNVDTGLKHIMDRHLYFSNRSDWYINQEGKYELDNPSKFSKESKPLFDYQAIAEDIYNPENQVESKHPELFEKYTGLSTRMENIPLQFHLIVYKDTKIVHTLFPQKKNFNKRLKILNFRRGNLNIKTKLIDKRFLIAKYPYYDAKDIVRYVIIIRLDNLTKFLTTFVQINSLSGQPVYTEQVGQTVLQHKMTPEDYFHAVENVDLSKVERVIKKFDKELLKE